MAIDVKEALREELAATIRRSARGLSLISGAAVVAATLDRDGVPTARAVPIVLGVALVLASVFRERALADLASVHGAERLERIRKWLPTRWVGLVILGASAVVGALEIVRGHATWFAIALVAWCTAAGLLVQFRLVPALKNAWDRLRELDTPAA